MARELKVVLTGDNRDLARMFKSAEKDGSAFERRMASMSSRAGSAFGSIAKGAGLAGAAIGVGLVVEAKRAFSAFEESNKIARQTGAVLKSTGGAANVTADQVANLSSALSKKTGVDDEAIQSGENLLLTFTNVRNEAGKGNDIFSQGTKALTDMSVALGQDTKSSAIQLGKALNDPIKGVTALQRVGVSFTADQKKQITTLVESGRTLDAQKLILRELTKEFGGSAAAQATSTDKMKVAVGNLEEAFGRGLAPAVNTVADQITKFATKAEPILIRIGTRLGDIFNRKDLDLAGKIKLSKGVLQRNLKPLGDEIAGALKDADLPDKLASAVEKAAPRIADAAAAAAPRAAGAFVNAFQNAGPWGKLITVAFLANKLGAFNAAGSLASNRLLSGLRSSTTKGAVSKAIGPGTSAAATAQGAVSGKAYSTSFAASSATAMPGTLGSQRGKFTRASRVLGNVMGLASAAAFALAFKPEIESVFDDFVSEAKRRFGDIGDVAGSTFDALLGKTEKNSTGFGRGGRAGAGDQTPLSPNVPPGARLPKPDRESNRGTGGRNRGQRHGGRASAARASVSSIASTPQQRAVQERRALALMESVWKRAARYLGAEGDPMPPVVFTYGADALFIGADEEGIVYFPNWATRRLLKGDDAMEQVLIHEWAHVYQREGLSGNIAEGGATAFARRVAPKVYGAMNRPFRNPSLRGDPYRGGVRAVRKRGEGFIMSGQFRSGGASGGTSRTVARASQSGGSGIVALGRQLQGEGYIVGEHPAFGGVAPVHTQNSYHYRGLAIDVNGGPGGEPGSLDALYARLQGRPGVVELLWRVKGHFDHLHVAVVGSTNPLGGSRGSGGSRSSGGTSTPVARPAPPQPKPMTRADRTREERSRTIDAVAYAERLAGRRAAGRRARRGVGRNGLPILPPGKGVERDPQTMADVLAAMPTGLDFANRDLAMAELSGDPDQIRKAQEAIRDYWQGQLTAAQGTADPRDDIDAAQGLKAALDALKSTIEDEKKARDEHTTALKTVGDEMKRQTDLAQQYASTSEFQKTKYLADIFSGQFGRGIIGRGFTAGVGVEVAYRLSIFQVA